MLKFCIVLCFCALSRSITPPRVLYGGWTPIVPGHPFYFGPAKRKNLEPSYHHQNHEHVHLHPDPSLGQYHDPPTHEVEHHIEHQVEFVNPEQYHHYNKQPETYHPSQSPHIQLPNKGQPITYGHEPKKSIFSYYPPQSAYEAPKRPDYDYKPVYFEIPRKPLDVFENPISHVTYNLPSIKDVPIRNLNLHNLKSLHHGRENTFLKVTPLGNVDSNALKHIGHINAEQIQYLNPDILPKHTKYPVIKDSSGGIPIRPAALSYLKYKAPAKKQNYESRHAKHGVSHAPYGAIHHPSSQTSVNNYKGANFQLDKYDPLKRPLNPIETKYYGDSHLQVPKLQQLKTDIHSISKLHLTNYNKQNQVSNMAAVSHFPGPHIYPTNHDLYSNIKYAPPIKTPYKSIGLGKNLLSPAIIDKHITSHMKKYFTPKFSNYSPVQPFYPVSVTKPIYATPGYPYTASKNLSPLPLRTFSRPVSPQLLQNYLHKDIKLHTLYKNPSVLTNIRGSPAIVEREVAIIHVPVTDHNSYSGNLQDYPNEKDYLYHTASTPESTQILDIVNLNESAPYVTLNKHIPVLKNNESYTHITLDYGRGQDLAHVTFVEPATDSQISPPPENNSISDSQHHNQYQYIFVSSNGIYRPNTETGEGGNEMHPSHETEAKKQFFHAYYAQSNHVPPPGYVKMTVEEFNNLFKNAEIRYVDSEPENISQSGQGHGNQH